MNIDFQLFAFISIDIIGSTLFKNKEKCWIYSFASFYEDINRILIEINYEFKTNYRILKYIGDEVIVSFDLRNSRDYINFIISITKLHDQTNSAIKKYLNTTDIELSTKMTVWLSPVCSTSKSICKFKIDNEIQADDFPGYDVFLIDINDVIGPNIDCGFRLTKYSSDNYIIVSIEMAYFLLLYKDNCFKKNSKNLNSVREYHLHGNEIFSFSYSTNGIQKADITDDIDDFMKMKIYHLHDEQLKGVNSVKQYPIIALTKDLNVNHTELTKETLQRYIDEKYLRNAAFNNYGKTHDAKLEDYRSYKIISVEFA